VNRLAILLLLMLVAACAGCDKRKRKPMSDKFPAWVPLLGQPLPGHGDRKAMKDAPYRQLTRDELTAVAYAFYPRISIADMDQMSISEYNQKYWYSPETIALAQVQEIGYSQLAKWQALCNVVRHSVPPVYIVAERTYPRYDPTYVIVVDAPVAPGTIDENHLVVHVSYLVPYYYYYELHSRRIDGKIQRDPLLYEVTPIFADVLAAIEREIDARFGYWRMPPDVALLEVPGIHIGGYFDDLRGIPPKLKDALFTPHRW
jgi:hypothetical protein